MLHPPPDVRLEPSKDKETRPVESLRTECSERTKRTVYLPRGTSPSTAGCPPPGSSSTGTSARPAAGLWEPGRSGRTGRAAVRNTWLASRRTHTELRLLFCGSTSLGSREMKSLWNWGSMTCITCFTWLVSHLSINSSSASSLSGPLHIWTERCREDDVLFSASLSTFLDFVFLFCVFTSIIHMCFLLGFVASLLFCLLHFVSSSLRSFDLPPEAAEVGLRVPLRVLVCFFSGCIRTAGRQRSAAALSVCSQRKTSTNIQHMQTIKKGCRIRVRLH